MGELWYWIQAISKEPELYKFEDDETQVENLRVHIHRSHVERLPPGALRIWTV
ncbi:hypothetical protein FRB93_011388 [Tulasnella sp. JGI-2019a]|nr:hypothetical protein FRB93_011388 [Tulasnella sp. JGI-2019a]